MLAQLGQMANRFFGACPSWANGKSFFLVLAQVGQMANRFFWCLPKLGKGRIEFFGACPTWAKGLTDFLTLAQLGQAFFIHSLCCIIINILPIASEINSKQLLSDHCYEPNPPPRQNAGHEAPRFVQKPRHDNGLACGAACKAGCFCLSLPPSKTKNQSTNPH